MNRRDTIKTIAASAFMGFTGLVSADQEAKMDWSDAEVEQMKKEIKRLERKIHTDQATYEEVVDVVNRVWDNLHEAHPVVHLMDSPIACKNADKGCVDFMKYWCLNFIYDSAKFQVMKAHGTEFNEEKLQMYIDWTRCCPFILFSNETIYVSKRPIVMQCKKDNSLHYCEFADGWNVDKRDEN